MSPKQFFLTLALIVSVFGSIDGKSIRVAAVQLALEAGGVETNLAKVERITREAFEQGAELVVLPEFFYDSWCSYD